MSGPRHGSASALHRGDAPPSKRKQEGVYYTPEWVARLVVDGTVGTKLGELREQCGLGVGDPPPGSSVAPPRVRLEQLDQLEREVLNLKIVDPACGEGILLVFAARALVRVRLWIGRERAALRAPEASAREPTHREASARGPTHREASAREPTHRDVIAHDAGADTSFDDDEAALFHDVAARNLYGVDLDAGALDRARTALGSASDLSAPPRVRSGPHLCLGNSLVGSDFYRSPSNAPPSSRRRGRVAVFDWRAAFPEVFARAADTAGFDCVIGNPPYVKLQHRDRAADPVTEYLTRATADDGKPLYESAQTGHCDLFLPFLEKGIRLLNARGHMGVIAPSAWLVNEYGAGLRAFVHERRALHRWVDFGDGQIFDDAATYTALQFFRGAPTDAIACTFVRDCHAADVVRPIPDALVSFAELAPRAPWVFTPDADRTLLARLDAECTRLARAADGIIVGVQTSADAVYHLERLGAGRYRSFAKCDAGEDVELEDALLRPLVSGKHVKRYLAPHTRTHLLFPYDDRSTPPRRLDASTLEARHPKTWAYLQTHEVRLRRRERGKMNTDDGWWAYNYPKNIGKQRLPKLLVPRLTRRLGVACDPSGAVALDNVDVNGVLARDEETLWFLAGVLNGPVANFVWKRRSRPFRGGFRAANRQFIAALPVPDAAPGERADVARRAQGLQALHGERQATPDEQRAQLDRAIDRAEAQMSELLFALYRLSDEERRLVESDRVA